MAVKRSRSAGRMLAVFEQIAASQPVGVSALARALEADKSAVQRDLMTLADAGWIRPAPGAAGQWELTPRVLTIARPPSSSGSLRQRARPLLDHLRAATGETAYLAVADGDHFVVLEAAESQQMLRMVPPVGIVIRVEGTATGRAVLACLPEEERERWLNGPVPADMMAEIAATGARGYAINDGDIVPGAVAISAAITGTDGYPIGALVLTAPADRLVPARRAEAGQLLRDAARALSQPG